MVFTRLCKITYINPSDGRCIVFLTMDCAFILLNDVYLRFNPSVNSLIKQCVFDGQHIISVNLMTYDTIISFFIICDTVPKSKP